MEEEITSKIEPNKDKIEEEHNKKSRITLKSIKNIKASPSKLPYSGEILIKKPLSTTVACFKSL